MIDFRNNRLPDFDNILATYRKDPIVDQQKICEIEFTYLLQNNLDDSHVDYATFEELCFPVDVDECGTSVKQKEKNCTEITTAC